MSRGLGLVQRRVLELFAAHPDEVFDTFDIGVRVYEIEPDQEGLRRLTEAQASAVRRALIVLTKKGLLCGGRGYRNGRRHWGLPECFARQDAPNIKHGKRAYREARAALRSR